MGSGAEAQAGPAPQGLLRALDHRPDLGTSAHHLREHINSQPHALKRISHGLPDFPANLAQGVGELGVPVIAHGHILPLPKTRSLGEGLL